MSRILTNNSTTAKKKRDQDRAKNTAKPRKTMITLDEMKHNLVQISDGQRTTLLSMTDQEFREWFNAFIESIVPHIKPRDGVKALIEQARSDVDILTLNKEARFHLVNDVYGTAAFRRSNIEIFVQTEEVVA